jgi:hypothetical protein
MPVTATSYSAIPHRFRNPGDEEAVVVGLHAALSLIE